MNILKKFNPKSSSILIFSNNYLYAGKNKISIANRNVLQKLTKQNLIFKPISFFSDEQNRNSKFSKGQLEQKFKEKTDQMLKQSPQTEQDQSSYVKSDNKLTKYLMGVTVLALMIVYAMMEVQGVRAQKRLDKNVTGITKISSQGKAHIGGQWTLINTKGQPFGSKDLHGTYYLIYFGFTNCPDICPNSLLKLAKALKKIRNMPEYQYMNIRTVFVSVDPDRDTPQKIQKFLSYFDSSFIGVTGKSNDDENLRQCMKKFKIYASKIEFEDQDTVRQGRKAYTIDHTILTYLMNDNNEYLTHLGGNLGEHELAKQIIQKIIANEHQKMQLLRAT